MTYPLVVPNVKKIRGLKLPGTHLDLLRDDLYLLIYFLGSIKI